MNLAKPSRRFLDQRGIIATDDHDFDLIMMRCEQISPKFRAAPVERIVHEGDSFEPLGGRVVDRVADMNREIIMSGFIVAPNHVAGIESQQAVGVQERVRPKSTANVDQKRADLLIFSDPRFYLADELANEAVGSPRIPKRRRFAEPARSRTKRSPSDRPVSSFRDRAKERASPSRAKQCAGASNCRDFGRACRARRSRRRSTILPKRATRGVRRRSFNAPRSRRRRSSNPHRTRTPVRNPQPNARPRHKRRDRLAPQRNRIDPTQLRPPTQGR